MWDVSHSMKTIEYTCTLVTHVTVWKDIGLLAYSVVGLVASNVNCVLRLTGLLR